MNSPVKKGGVGDYIKKPRKSEPVKKRPFSDRTTANDSDDLNLSGPLRVTTAAGMPGTYALKRALHPTIAGKPVVMGNLELSMRLRELERRVNRIDRALVVIALAIISFFSILAVMG